MNVVPPAAPETPKSEVDLNRERFDALWPDIRSDMMGIRDVERALSGAESLRNTLRSNIDPVAKPSIVGRTVQTILDQIGGNTRHLLLLPWLGLNGGSDRLSQRFIRLLMEHYSSGGLCILGVDEMFNPTEEMRQRLGPSLVSFNDVRSKLTFRDRVEILDRVLIQTAPHVVHTLNSYVAWKLIEERGAFLGGRSRLYGHIYADIRIDEVPVEVFWVYLPNCFDHMSGIISDNKNVIRCAQANFGYTTSDMARFHVVRTPILGSEKDNAAGELRPFSRAPGEQSLWFGRFTPEKRPDMVAKVAARMPHRRFVLYGPTIKGSFPVDLEAVRACRNIEIRGEFERLEDLPFETFDSYMFTTAAEGTPLAIMEAARFGMPVVAPDIGGIREFIDNDTGWLLSPDEETLPARYAEALDEIARNPALAAVRVAAAQRRLVENHSWSCFELDVRNIPGYLA